MNDYSKPCAYILLQAIHSVLTFVLSKYLKNELAMKTVEYYYNFAGDYFAEAEKIGERFA